MVLDPSQAISPDEAAVLAVIINPELRAERQQRAVASAQLLQAGLLPNPQLTGGMDFPYKRESPDNFNAYNLGLSWDVTALIARDARIRSASADAASIELQIAWKEWEIAQAARTAAYDLLSLDSQLQVSRQADEELGQTLDVVRRAVDQHNKTLLDLAGAEASAQDAHATFIAQQGDLAQQRLRLNRALGLPYDRVINIRDPGGLPSRLDPPSTESLLTGIQDRRLDLLALRRGYESEDAKLRAAILGQFPNINLGFNAARDTSNVQSAGFGVTVDIPLFDRNQGQIAVETATRQTLFDEYADRVFVANSDVASAVQGIRSTNEQIAASAQAIPGLESLVRTYQSSLAQGNVDVLSLYAAKSALTQKRLAHLKLQQQLVQNWIALEIASGRFLPITSAPSVSTTPSTREAKP